MSDFLQLFSLSVGLSAFVSFFPALHFVSCVGLQQGYFCFAHLSPYCLLCHGTVNVSDSDRSCWTSSFICFVFILLSFPHSFSSSLGGEQHPVFIWQPSLHTGRGERLQTNSFATLKVNTGSLTRPNIYLSPPPNPDHPSVQLFFHLAVPHASRWISYTE